MATLWQRLVNRHTKSPLPKRGLITVIIMAERRGLEPRHLSASPDFKSGSLANSDISPFLAHLKFYYNIPYLSRYIGNSFIFFYFITSIPIYGLKTSGTVTVPSSF